MKSSRWWIALFFALALALSGGSALAQGKGQGKGRDKDKHGDDDRDDRRFAFSDHDRDDVRRWCVEHERGLPPGLAKRDRLPPGLERQLIVRGTLPPGLRKKAYPVPVELERRLPPPPVGYAHLVIGGHIVLVNRRTWLVMDIIHIE
jgi:Ni/Co efflux regulator RcnB